MKTRKLITSFFVLLILALFGALEGLAYMRETTRVYCGPQAGIVGFLQSVNLMSVGDCRLKKGSTTQCQDKGECRISNPSGQIRGKCTQRPDGCECVPR
jgi:hypothetical protein